MKDSNPMVTAQMLRGRVRLGVVVLGTEQAWSVKRAREGWRVSARGREVRNIKVNIVR
jgi:hypothetical protein